MQMFVGPPQPKKSRVMRGTLIVKDGVKQNYTLLLLLLLVLLVLLVSLVLVLSFVVCSKCIMIC